MRRVVVTLSAFVAMFCGVSTLPAVQPVTFTASGGGANWIGDCPDFEVWEDVSWEAKGKDYFNQDGEWIRTRVHWVVEGTVFNADAPDNFLPYKNVVYTEHYSVGTGEDRYTGLWALVTVPGYGVIFIDVGMIVLDEEYNIIFEAGKHQWFNANVEALCDHLAD